MTIKIKCVIKDPNGKIISPEEYKRRLKEYRNKQEESNG